MTPSSIDLLLHFDEVARQIRYPVWQNFRLKRPLHKDLL
jgi:hypothetical protein